MSSPNFSSEDEQNFFSRMADAVAHRYDLNAEKSLRDVYQLNADFLDTHSDAEFAFANREKILAILADPRTFEQLVDLFVRRSIEFTYLSNQFIQLDYSEEARFRRIYTDYMYQLSRVLSESSSEPEISARLNELVKEHFLDLRSNISRFFDPEVSSDAQANVILQKVVCAEYPPEMQLDILGIDTETIIQPVLDLGCGKSGSLVHYLRQNGIAATGVDRMVDPNPNLIQANWLDLPLHPGYWGTVISHMAFTNHFLFHHLYCHGDIEPYGRQYMAVLKSLRPRGSYYYAPGLPFIETYLPPETYRVSRKQIVDTLYACRVMRGESA